MITLCSQTLLWFPTAEEDRRYGHRRLPSLPHLHGLRPGTVTVHYPFQTRTDGLNMASVKVCLVCVMLLRLFFRVRWSLLGL